MPRHKSLRLLAWLLPCAAVLAVVAVTLFAGDQHPKVLEVQPGAGRSDVAITEPIVVRFSRPMDPSSVEARFSVEPGVGGSYHWQREHLTFVPRVALEPGRQYTVTLRSGAATLKGPQLETGRSWSFRTRLPQLLYLGLPSVEAQIRQLFVSEPTAGSVPRQLTDNPWGVWDYGVHPQGDGIIYAAERADGGTDLWRMDRGGDNQELLLACPDEACLNPKWSPAGGQLAYERRGIWSGAPNLDPKAGRIWLIDPDGSRTHPLLDYEVPIHSPAWGPVGSRLAYISPLLPGVEVYTLESGELQSYGNDWGSAPVWSPDGLALVIPDLALAGEALVVRLVRLDLDTGESDDISGEAPLTKDTAPAWSPGGGWIAVARQLLSGGDWTPGRQLWLIRPDGSEGYPLVSDPSADLFGVSWRPDGGALAYLSTDLSSGPQPVPEVSIWVLDLSTKESVLVTSQGVLPRWLP